MKIILGIEANKYDISIEDISERKDCVNLQLYYSVVISLILTTLKFNR